MTACCGTTTSPRNPIGYRRSDWRRCCDPMGISKCILFDPKASIMGAMGTLAPMGSVVGTGLDGIIIRLGTGRCGEVGWT